MLLPAGGVLQKVRLLLVPAGVVLAMSVTGTGLVYGQSQSSACSCITIPGNEGESNTVTVVVVVNGSHSSISIDQQTVKSDGRIQVNIDVEFGGEVVTVSGEKAVNDSLVFNITRNGELINESVVINGSEYRTLVVQIDGDGTVHTTRNDEAMCDSELDDIDTNDGGIDDNTANGGRLNGRSDNCNKWWSHFISH